MPRKRLILKHRVGISRRLRAFARGNYGSQEEFYRKMGVDSKTGWTWFGKDPKVPDLPTLARFAEKSNVSLDWLVMGDKPELRRRETTTGTGELLALLESVLRAQEAESEDEAEAAWNQMAVYRTEDRGFDAILHLAANGVRPLYREMLRRYRVNASVEGFAVEWSRRFSETSPLEKADIEEFAKRLARHVEPVDAAVEVDRTVFVPQGKS